MMSRAAAGDLASVAGTGRAHARGRRRPSCSRTA
jgi:hypothetical protein